MDIENDLKKYFLTKGYSNTLKNFDIDSKNDIFNHILDPDFCVKKVQNSIITSDYLGHKEIWKIFTQCFANYLSPQHLLSFEKLKIESWKTFLAQASKQSRNDKFSEAIVHVINLTDEFKDWIVLTSISYPINHKIFGIYFTKSWMNVFLISLHNMFNMMISAIINNKSVYLQQLKIQSKLATATDIIMKKVPKKL